MQVERSSALVYFNAVAGSGLDTYCKGAGDGGLLSSLNKCRYKRIKDSLSSSRMGGVGIDSSERAKRR